MVDIFEQVTGKKITDEGVEEAEKKGPVEEIVDKAVKDSRKTEKKRTKKTDEKSDAEATVDRGLERSGDTGTEKKDDRTNKQKAIDKQLDRIDEMEEGGFTEHEKYAAKAGQDKIDQAEQRDRIKKQKSDMEEHYEDEEQKINRQIDKLKDSEADKIDLTIKEEGKDSSKEERTVSTDRGIEILQNRKDEISEEKAEILKDIEDSEMDAKASESALESYVKKYREEDPKKGRTTEDFIDEHRGKVSALTGFQPEGIRTVISPLTGEDVQEDIVKPMVDEIRRGERSPGDAAVRSLGSAPGAVGMGAATGAGVKAGISGAYSYGGATAGKAAQAGSTLAGLGFAGNRATDITKDVQEGRTGDAIQKGVTYGLGLAGVVAGGSAMGKPKKTGTSAGRTKTNLVDKGAGKTGKGAGKVTQRYELPFPRKSSSVIHQKGNPPTVQSTGPTVSRTAGVKMNLQQSGRSAYGGGKYAITNEKGKILDKGNIISKVRGSSSRKVGTKTYKGGRTVTDIGKGRKFGHVLSENLVTAKHSDKSISVDLAFSGGKNQAGTTTLGKTTVYDGKALDVTRTGTGSTAGTGTGSSSSGTSMPYTVDAGKQVQAAKTGITTETTGTDTGTGDQITDIALQEAQKQIGKTVPDTEARTAATFTDTTTAQQDADVDIYSADTMTEQVGRKARRDTGFDSAEIVVDTAQNIETDTDTGTGTTTIVQPDIDTREEEDTRTGVDLGTKVKKDTRKKQMPGTFQETGPAVDQRTFLGTRTGTGTRTAKGIRTTQFQELGMDQKLQTQRGVQNTTNILSPIKSKAFTPPGFGLPFISGKRKNKRVSTGINRKQGRVTGEDRDVQKDFISYSLAKAQFGEADFKKTGTPKVLGFDIRSQTTVQEEEEGFDLNIF